MAGSLGWKPRELAILAAAARRLAAGFRDLPGAPAPDGSAATSDLADARLAGVLMETAARLRDNYPYFHPLYAGQMLKPPHPVARLAYALAMLINPNNHALDGGRASSAMEKEAVAELAAMVGWDTHLGHLTSSGTLANLEALWVASRLAPGRGIVASSEAHYTHRRMSELLSVPFETVAVDRHGRLDVRALERMLTSGDVGTVVATLGTTALGAVDPLDEIVALRDQYGFRLHVDAAYGGYFRLAAGLQPAAAQAFAALGAADSVVIDPHKHGLQPYGCGAVLFRDPGVGRIYRHDSPYTYFTSDELHLGEISLECSRAGAAAVALWATQRLLPLSPAGARGSEFANGLDKSLQAAHELYRRLQRDRRVRTLVVPELDIVVWAGAGARASDISRASDALFRAAQARNLHLALVRVDRSLAAAHWPEVEWEGAATVTCLRSCLMKPEHLDWLDRSWAILDDALTEVIDED